MIGVCCAAYVATSTVRNRITRLTFVRVMASLKIRPGFHRLFFIRRISLLTHYWPRPELWQFKSLETVFWFISRISRWRAFVKESWKHWTWGLLRVLFADAFWFVLTEHPFGSNASTGEMRRIRVKINSYLTATEWARAVIDNQHYDYWSNKQAMLSHFDFDSAIRDVGGSALIQAPLRKIDKTKHTLRLTLFGLDAARRFCLFYWLSFQCSLGYLSITSSGVYYSCRRDRVPLDTAWHATVWFDKMTLKTFTDCFQGWLARLVSILVGLLRSRSIASHASCL